MGNNKAFWKVCTIGAEQQKSNITPLKAIKKGFYTSTAQL
jgi:hypothetical protein